MVLDGYTLNPGDLSWKGLEELGELEVFDRTPAGLVMERARAAEVLFTNKVILGREQIAGLPRLKYIGVLATGTNVVDTLAASEAGVTVTNIPAYSTASVAQLVFAHLLNFTNRVELHATEVRNGKWSSQPDFSYQSSPQTELAGKTLGIVGFGRIGQSVAGLAQAFGMRVLYYNRSPKNIPALQATPVSLETLFADSDFVTLHCPLTSENRGFVNSSLLSLMKPTAFLVNTARGPLIREEELAGFLNKGLLAGAGLDVLSTEPPAPGNPLLYALNCHITPHMAWATFEARSRLMAMAAGNLKDFLEGRPCNRVN